MNPSVAPVLNHSSITSAIRAGVPMTPPAAGSPVPSDT
jgi:hypothetical protein